MKVNMTPNPLDVVTIHASQGDTEAREWEFELHNNGELIDTSGVTDQMVFKAYKGGTEQLLPENTSTPTTTPILADIQYPDGLRTDQYFTYRETPTTVSNKARIKTIKGNTLVWNQLINATDGSGTIGEGVTYTTSDGVITLNGTPTSDGFLVIGDAFSAKANHKYLLKGCPSGGSGTTYQLFVSRSSVAFPQGNRLQDTGNGKIVSALGDENNLELRLYVYSSSPTFSNTKFIPQIFDLTAMGLDSLTNAEILQWFANYFSLSYYSYNQGSLLSFNGNGIKTVGKNLFSGAESYSRENAGYYIREGGTNNPLPLKLAKGTYTISIKSTVAGTSQLEFFSGGITSADRFLAPYIILVDGVKTYTFTIDRQSDYIRLYGSFVGTISDIQIESGSTATPYEPYTSSTLSLPISTYFPTGMKSAGSVYDELSDKAITRVGSVTYNGGITSMESQNKLFILGTVDNIKRSEANEVANLTANGYTANSLNNARLTDDNYIVTFNRTLFLRIKGITTINDANTYLASNPVTTNYELATPTETSFSTASLVTENAEIPLSNNDGVLIGKCTEELSAEPGFHDAKIKLADEDGECYSNKIQLHIERSPQ